MPSKVNTSPDIAYKKRGNLVKEFVVFVMELFFIVTTVDVRKIPKGASLPCKLMFCIAILETVSKYITASGVTVKPNKIGSYELNVVKIYEKC